VVLICIIYHCCCRPGKRKVEQAKEGNSTDSKTSQTLSSSAVSVISDDATQTIQKFRYVDDKQLATNQVRRQNFSTNQLRRQNSLTSNE